MTPKSPLHFRSNRVAVGANPAPTEPEEVAPQPVDVEDDGVAAADNPMPGDYAAPEPDTPATYHGGGTGLNWSQISNTAFRSRFAGEIAADERRQQREAAEWQRFSAQQNRNLAAARKAAEKQANSKREADFRRRGLSYYKNDNGEIIADQNDDGSAKFKPLDETRYDEQGAYQYQRNERGVITIKDPDQSAPYGNHENDPEGVYRKNKSKPWERIGDAEEVLKSGNLGAAAAAANYLRPIKQAEHLQKLQEAQGRKTALEAVGADKVFNKSIALDKYGATERSKWEATVQADSEPIPKPAPKSSGWFGAGEKRITDTDLGRWEDSEAGRKQRLAEAQANLDQADRYSAAEKAVADLNNEGKIYKNNATFLQHARAQERQRIKDLPPIRARARANQLSQGYEQNKQALGADLQAFNAEKQMLEQEEQALTAEAAQGVSGPQLDGFNARRAALARRRTDWQRQGVTLQARHDELNNQGRELNDFYAGRPEEQKQSPGPDGGEPPAAGSAAGLQPPPPTAPSSAGQKPDENIIISPNTQTEWDGKTSAGKNSDGELELYNGAKIAGVLKAAGDTPVYRATGAKVARKSGGEVDELAKGLNDKRQARQDELSTKARKLYESAGLSLTAEQAEAQEKALLDEFKKKYAADDAEANQVLGEALQDFHEGKISAQQGQQIASALGMEKSFADLYADVSAEIAGPSEQLNAAADFATNLIAGSDRARDHKEYHVSGHLMKFAVGVEDAIKAAGGLTAERRGLTPEQFDARRHEAFITAQRVFKQQHPEWSAEKLRAEAERDADRQLEVRRAKSENSLEVSHLVNKLDRQETTEWRAANQQAVDAIKQQQEKFDAETERKVREKFPDLTDGQVKAVMLQSVMRGVARQKISVAEMTKNPDWWIELVPSIVAGATPGPAKIPMMALAGLFSGGSMSGLLVAAQKAENGTATQEDLELLQTFQQESARDKTFWAGALDLVAQSIPFMQSFSATAGIAKGARAKAQQAAIAALKKTIGAKATGNLVKLAASDTLKGAVTRTLAKGLSVNLVEEPARLLFASGGTITNNMVRDALPQFDFTQNEAGELSATLNTPSKTGLDALTGNLNDQMIENTSERFGGVFGNLGKPLVRKVLGNKKIMGLALAKWLFNLNDNVSKSKIAGFLKAANFNGPLGEMAEERYGDFLRAVQGVAKGEGFNLKIPSTEQLLQEAVAFAVPGTIGGVSGHFARKEELKKADAEARQKLTQTRQDYTDFLASATPESLAQELNIDVAQAQAALELGETGKGAASVKLAEQQQALQDLADKAEKKGDLEGLASVRRQQAELTNQQRAAAVEDVKAQVAAVAELDAAEQALAEQEAQPPDPNATPEQVAARQQELADQRQMVTRARALAKIAGGTQLNTLTTDEMAAVGVMGDGKGGFKSVVSARELAGNNTLQASPVQVETFSRLSAEGARVEDRAPIITDGAIKQLRQAFPNTAKLIGTNESQARANALRRTADMQRAAVNAAKFQTSNFKSQLNAKSQKQNSQTKTADGQRQWTGYGRNGTQVTVSAATRKEAEAEIAARLPQWEMIDADSVEEVAAPSSADGGNDATKPADSNTPAATVKRQEVKLALQKFIDRTTNPQTREFARRMAEIIERQLDVYESLFPSINLKSKFGGSGIGYNPTTASLEINLRSLAFNLTRSSRDFKSAEKILQAQLREELIHFIATEEIDDNQVVELWLRLPEQIKDAVRKTYFNTLVDKNLDLPQEDEKMQYKLGHEFLRMLAQDKFFRQVTESVDVSPGLLAELRELLEKIGAHLRGLLARDADADTQAAVADALGVIEQRLVALGAIEASKTESATGERQPTATEETAQPPANAPPRRFDLGGYADDVQQAATEAFAGLLSAGRRAVATPAAAQQEIDSWREADAKFAAQVDAALAGVLSRYDTVRLGGTPAVLLALNAPDLPVVMAPSVIRKVVQEKHAVAVDDLKRLPEQLRNPVAVFSSSGKADSVVVLTELFENGQPVIAAVALEREKNSDHFTVNEVTSVYGKQKNVLADWVRDGLLIYEDKNKTLAWSRRARLQLPGRRKPIQGSYQKILSPAEVVNHPAQIKALAENKSGGLNAGRRPEVKIPTAKRPAFNRLAVALLRDGVSTPPAVREFLEAVDSDGGALPYGGELWSLMQAFDQRLKAIPWAENDRPLTKEMPKPEPNKPLTFREQWQQAGEYQPSKRAKMLVLLLRNLKVPLTTAQVFARWFDETNGELAGNEALRDAAIAAFRQWGGQFRDEVSVYSEAVDSILAADHAAGGTMTRGQAEQQAADARADREAKQAAVDASNTALAEKILASEVAETADGEYLYHDATSGNTDRRGAAAEGLPRPSAADGESDGFLPDTGLENQPGQPAGTQESQPAAVSVAGNQVRGIDGEAAEGGAAEPLPPVEFPQLGNRGTAYTDNNDAVEFQWAVIDADGLLTSNNADFTPNPRYPQALQPRDRSRAASREQVNDIAKHTNFNRLADSDSVGGGAPIVGADGVVESGNGRVMGLRLAYQESRPNVAEYKAQLVANAGKYGLDGAAIAQMRNPVLARVRRTELNRLEFVRAANVTNVAQQSDVEQARVDAAKITPAMLNGFQLQTNGGISTDGQDPLVRAFVDRVVPPSERGGVVDGAGNLSARGLARMRNALFVYAYGGGDAAGVMLRRIAEDVSPDGKNIVAAMLGEAGRMANLRARIADGERFDVSIADDVVRAAQQWLEMTQRGDRVEDYLKQGEMFGRDELRDDILQFIDANKRGVNRLRRALANYVALADAAGSPKQGNIFGANQAPAKAALWALAKKAAADGEVLRAGRRATDLRPRLKIFNQLFERQRAGERLNPAQTALFNRVERELGQATMFDEDAPSAWDLTLEGETYEEVAQTVSPAWTEQGVLFASRRPVAWDWLPEEQRRKIIDPRVRELINGGHLHSAEWETEEVRRDEKTGRYYYEKLELARRLWIEHSPRGADGYVAPMVTLDEHDPILQPAVIKNADGEYVYQKERTLDGKNRKNYNKLLIGSLVAKFPQTTGQPEILMTQGGGGAGKSTALRQMQKRGELSIGKFAKGNADDFKENNIQEYARITALGDPRGTQATHLESAMLLDMLLNEALKRKVSVLYDGTLSYVEAIDRITGQFAGYRQRGISVFVSPKTAKVSAIERWISEGRFVAVDVQLKAHRGAEEMLDYFFSKISSGEAFYREGKDYRKFLVKNENGVLPIDLATYNILRREYEKRNETQGTEGGRDLRGSGGDNQPGVDGGGVGGQVPERGHVAGEAGEVDRTNERGVQGRHLGLNAGRRARSAEDGPSLFDFLTPAQTRQVRRREVDLFGVPTTDEDLFSLNDLEVKNETANQLRAGDELPRQQRAGGNRQNRQQSADAGGGADVQAELGGFAADAGHARGAGRGERQRGDGERGGGDDLFADGQRAGNVEENQGGGEGVSQRRGGGLPRPDRTIPPVKRQAETAGENGRVDGENRGTDRGFAGDHGTAGTGTQRGNSEPERGTESLGTPAGQAAILNRPAPNSPERNHVIADGDTLAPRGDAAKLNANLAAIRLLRQLETERRNPTVSEKKTLAQYTGWGGLSQVFDDRKAEQYADGEHTTRRNTARSYERHGATYAQLVDDYRRQADALENWHRKWGKWHAELKSLLTPEEYRAAAASTLNAHYTSPEVIRAMWRMVERLGFKGGTVLEPAGGVGHFLGLMPAHLADRSVTEAVELDSVTGRILAKLYPETSAQVTGFEDASIPDNSVDLAISNVPFANVTVSDKTLDALGAPRFSLHNYFFARALQKVRPGGLVAFITTSNTLDANAPQRRWLAEHADFIAALRLPNTAFKGNAGTEVTTDIIFLRKPDGSPSATAESFAGLQTARTRRGADIDINEYFARQPAMILGELDNDGSMYGAKEQMTVHPFANGEPLTVSLDQALARLPENVIADSEEAKPRAESGGRKVSAGGKLGTLTLNDAGGVVINDAAGDEEILQPKHRQLAVDFIKLRDTLNELYRLEATAGVADAELDAQRARLNQAYDAFTLRHGFVHASAKLLNVDPDYYRLAGAELEEPPAGGSLRVALSRRKQYRKGDVFTKRVLTPRVEPVKADNLTDATGISLGWRGRLDADYIGSLLSIPRAEAERQLLDSGLAFRNPASGLLETSEEYLSGNVRQKLAVAEAAVADSDAYRRNVEELRKVQPATVKLADINFHLGSAWIPAEVVQSFARDVFQQPNLEVIYTPGVGEVVGDSWTVSIPRRFDSFSSENEGTYAGGGFNAAELLEKALNLQQPEVFKKIGDNERVFDQTATTQAKMALQKIKDAFAPWVMSRPAVSERLQQVYNDTNNSHVLRRYDGSHLKLPWVASGFELYSEKKNTVWRALQDGRMLIAHGVGGGKTIIGTAIAMELRRLGQARKPLMVVHNATLEQFAATIGAMAPTARVLVGRKEDLAAAKRKEFMAKIAAGDWDMVVMAHSSFDQIKDDPRFERQILAELEDELTAAIIDQGGRTDGKLEGKNPTVKEMQKQLKRLRERVKDLQSRKVDDVLTFQELGVDALIVDEAHLYKKLPFVSKLNRVAGIDGGESLRGTGLLTKARFIQ
ncbi:MAG: zeta toxin family protein, partial [Verrucomicrobiales bacterium]|nr:zeta toxin family protein [Verrucomicrobiales bacterium]